MKAVLRIIKWLAAGIGILIAAFALYLLTIGLLPGIQVPKQPLKKIKSKPVGVLAADPDRIDVSFPVDGTPVHAWYYPARSASMPAPCVVMGHGFGGTKAAGLHNYAVRYQAAGLSVLAFDYRHFGDSGGTPRQLIWIPYQLKDWQGAVAYARRLKDVAADKIALWGSSFSGGHVIVIAAEDQRVACVSAQCPGLDNHAAGEMALERLGIKNLLRNIMHAQRDIVRSWLGLSAHKIPLVGKPGSIAFMDTPDAYELFPTLLPDDFVNEACARILLRAGGYRPVKHAKDVRCPVLLQICDNDNLTPASAAEETAKQLGTLAEVKHYPIGHFDIYIEENFEKAVADQLVFFRKHLL